MRDLATAADLANHPTVGCTFVPTMGALHEGHLALIRRAALLRIPARPVVVSIFVNPTQFGPGEDFTRYPRMLEKDVASAESAGADLVFAPNVEVIYPPGQRIDVPQLPPMATQPQLEDAFRPTHFAGVCQVVARLFELIQPAFAIFGEKDFQQLQVIQQMVDQEPGRWSELEVIAHPIVREPDGLAMSSRNVYLKPEDRDRALGLSRALNEASRIWSDPVAVAKHASSHHSEFRLDEQIEHAMLAILRNHDLVVDYAVVRDAETLTPIWTFDRPARALIAARLGSVRLIDNAGLDVHPRWAA